MTPDLPTVYAYQVAHFSNMSSKIVTMNHRIDLFDPLVLTQSMSFLLGAFTAIAFVIASRCRY